VHDPGGRAGPARPPRRRRRPHLAALVALLALGVAVAGCGSGKPGGVASLGGSATPTTSGSKAGGGKDLSNDLPQLLAFARCMRQHGINSMPDPQITAQGIDQRDPPRMSRNDPRLKAAEQACHQYGSLGPAKPNLGPPQPGGPRKGGGGK
jgi:hypothetical protein